MKIPLDQITISRRLLRRSLDPDAIRALAEDIERNGQIQPIAVRRSGDQAYRLIAGRRRIEAMRLLGRLDIDAHVMDTGPADEVRGAAENIKRVQLTPLEEADVVADMARLDDMSIGEIAAATGHGISWVQDRLALLQLDKPLQNAVHERKLSISAAMLLQQIPDPEDRAYLLHVARVNGATVHQIQAWLQDRLARQALTRPPGFEGEVPQPPPPPARPPQPCFACHADVDPSYAVMVRICLPCLEELRTAAGGDPAPPAQA